MNQVPIIYADLKTTAEMVALSESTVQQLVRDKSFPKPRLLSKNRVGYLVREINEWAETRPVSELLPPPNTGAKKLGPTKQEVQDDRQAA